MRLTTAAFAAAVLAGMLLAQSQFGIRSLRGPAIWLRDGGSGNDILVDLDPKTLALDPPGTAGGRPVLRAIAQTGPVTAIRQRATVLVYNGQPMPLPETPLPGTLVRVTWSGIDQPYTLSGNLLTPSGPGWVNGDSLIVQYFY